MKLLLVCTGNTCRSPLAEAILRRELEARGVAGVTVSSAGTGAWDGVPASEGSYLVGLEHGLDLSNHRARLLTRELVEEADLILTMGRSHVARAEALGGAGRTQLLGEFAGRDGPSAEVRDPFGGELEQYREAYRDLASLLAAVAERLAEGRGAHER
ncbi:MAG: low molecular weight protein arginine phosphatase [Gemmatimonadales bacterium]